jgi:hypothetical protein
MGIAHGASIERQFHKPPSSTGQLGRPPLLPEEAQRWMIGFFYTPCAEDNPVTYAELLDVLEYDHGIIMSGDSLRHIVRNTTTLKSVVGIPKDSERLAVDASETDAWSKILSEQLMGVSRRFVFNVDETDCSEHIDSHEVTIVVPIDYPDPLVPMPVTPHTKRSILAACITADRYRMKPFVIVNQPTVETGV